MEAGSWDDGKGKRGGRKYGPLVPPILSRRDRAPQVTALRCARPSSAWSLSRLPHVGPPEPAPLQLLGPPEPRSSPAGSLHGAARARRRICRLPLGEEGAWWCRRRMGRIGSTIPGGRRKRLEKEIRWLLLHLAVQNPKICQTDI